MCVSVCVGKWRRRSHRAIMALSLANMSGNVMDWEHNMLTHHQQAAGSGTGNVSYTHQPQNLM